MVIRLTEKSTCIGKLSSVGYIYFPVSLTKKIHFNKFVSVKKEGNAVYISPKKNFFGSEGENKQLDYLNRIYMGKQYLSENMENGKPVNLKFTYSENEQIIIVTPLFTSCVFCGATEGLMTFSNKKICKDCFESLHEIYFDNE